MEHRNSLRQLSDAIDLLVMLEQLSKGFENDKLANSEVPWAGIKLTLGQTRQLVEGAYRDIYRDVDASEPVQAPIAHTQPKQSRGASLADRVQPLPQLAGYVRDLLTPDSEQRASRTGTDLNPAEDFRFNDRLLQNAD